MFLKCSYFIFLLARHFEAGFVLNLFLIFRDFEALCSFFVTFSRLNLLFLSEKHFEAGFVLNLFLIFRDFEARCSYKIVLIKKECN